ncbi:MAG: UvrD-helicase domain-containing protein [Nitriliruptoraceae bacterium]
MTSGEDEAHDLDAPRPGDKRAAMEAEQDHLDRVHDRVELLRRRAEERAAEAAADRSGHTFQARFERDVTAHHHASRRARYTFGDVESLAFGRLDLADGDHFHVGRVSVIDEDGDVLLVDWRAPAAGAFYQATAARPLGVARRRTLVIRGRQLLDLDDELVDGAAADRLDLHAVTGQGALLAALSRERSSTMRDIVATIQEEQDRIIRAPATGTLVVTGGPGTGKTVVALHRVAYLLYRDRERFEGRGVLVVGPSAAFTEYTARVLPALGEDRAVQRPLSALAPRGAHIRGWDGPEVARIKGDERMVTVLHRLLAATLPPIPPTTRVSFEGTTLSVPAGKLQALRDRHLAKVRADREGAAYHDRTEAAEEALVASLFSAWSSTHRSAGGRVPDDRHGSGFDSALSRAPEVTLLRRCFWPALRATSVLAEVADGEVSLDEVAEGILDDAERGHLAAAWREAETWTVDDVALLDELAAMLGTPPAERRRDPKRAQEDEGIRLGADEFHLDVAPVDVEAEGYRDFAHVVVDEAQDLSPMQWRAVARRGPYASWTVVGDLAQRSRIADPATWAEVAALIGRRNVEITELTVNYRTPAEIAVLATDVLVAAGHDPELAPRPVRSTGQPPRHVVADDPLSVAVEQVVELLAERGGTVGLLADVADVAALETLLAGLPSDLEVDRVRVLEVRAAKGLEFDDVVLAAPERIVAQSEIGTHQLYVAVTRATRSLTLVTSPDAELPGLGRCVQVTAGTPGCR